MNGWQVMAAPLALVVQVGALMAVALGVAWTARRLTAPAVRSGDVGRGAAPVSDGSIMAAYDGALADGWPPGQLATFVEVGRRAGTSGRHVEAVIARRWAA
jgi:hypothetical protein